MVTTAVKSQITVMGGYALQGVVGIFLTGIWRLFPEESKSWALISGGFIFNMTLIWLQIFPLYFLDCKISVFWSLSSSFVLYGQPELNSYFIGCPINRNQLYSMFIWSMSVASRQYSEKQGLRLNVNTCRFLEIPSEIASTLYILSLLILSATFPCFNCLFCCWVIKEEKKDMLFFSFSTSHEGQQRNMVPSRGKISNIQSGLQGWQWKKIEKKQQVFVV